MHKLISKFFCLTNYLRYRIKMQNIGLNFLCQCPSMVKFILNWNVLVSFDWYGRVFLDIDGNGLVWFIFAQMVWFDLYWMGVVWFGLIQRAKLFFQKISFLQEFPNCLQWSQLRAESSVVTRKLKVQSKISSENTKKQLSMEKVQISLCLCKL